MKRKKRKARVTLSETQQISLVRRGYAGEKWVDLAREYNVHKSTIERYRSKYPKSAFDKNGALKSETPMADASAATLNPTPRNDRDVRRARPSRATIEPTVRSEVIDNHVMCLFKINAPLEAVFAGVAQAVYNAKMNTPGGTSA